MRTEFFRNLIIIFLIALFSTVKPGFSQTDFPQKPITIYVHSKPGSAIDITTRQLTIIARKYTEATILVENKTGGSGVIAMQKVLDKKNDGYSVLAMTKSFISTIMLSNSGIDMNDFQYLAALVVDQEVLITNRHASVTTIDQIIEDAKLQNGKQKWLGPLVGGVDHLMAVEIWEKLDIEGEWIPFEGGSDALAALMGEHGTVYVGNPVDIIGRPDLTLAVVAAPQRLAKYPDVPTFTELGYDILDEVLWRGYVVKKGTPPEAFNFLKELMSNVSRDPEWIKFISQSSAKPVFISDSSFADMVNQDQKEAKLYLQKSGLIDNGNDIEVIDTNIAGIAILAIFILILLYIYYRKKPYFHGEIIIPVGLIALNVFLFLMTLNFPTGKLGAAAGPAAMPRLWIFGLIIFSAWLIISNIKNPPEPLKGNGNLRKSLLLAALMVFYIIGADIIGFYLSTFIFLLAGAYILTYGKYIIAFIFSGGFVAFSYLVFKIILKVPLPLGLFE